MTPVGTNFQPKKNTVLPWAIGGAIGLIAAVLGLNGVGLLRFGASTGNGNLAASSKFSGSLAQGQQIAGSLRMPAQQGASLEAVQEHKSMPQDVYDWLKHLEKCEAMKEKLMADQMNDLMVEKNRLNGAGGLSVGDVNKLSNPEGGVDLPEGLQSAFDAIGKMDKDWKALDEFFQSKPPPAECVPIRDAYQGGLAGIVDAIGSVQQIAGNYADPNKASSDPQAAGATSDLNGLSKGSKKSIDDELQSADDLLGEICKKYSTAKWFSIDAHGAGLSPMAGLGG